MQMGMAMQHVFIGVIFAGILAIICAVAALEHLERGALTGRDVRQNVCPPVALIRCADDIRRWRFGKSQPD
jgi:hypothetical protein